MLEAPSTLPTNDTKTRESKTMSNTTPVSNGSTLYLQWHVTGNAGGQWNASTTTSGPFNSLDKWSIGTGTYTFVFTVKQGDGTYSYPKVFMTMKDGGASNGAGVAYGALWDGSDPRTQLTIVGPLALAAGQTITGDPKIQISGSTNVLTQSQTPVKWDGKQWWVGSTDTSGTTTWSLWNGQPITIPLYENTASLMVYDQTASTSAPHQCALFQYDKSNVGELYDGKNGNPQQLTSSGQCATFDFTAAQSYSVNLFSSFSTSGSTTLG